MNTQHIAAVISGGVGIVAFLKLRLENSMMRRIITVVVSGATAVLSTALAGGPPAVPVTTSFDTGLDGWDSNTPAQVAWSSSGGNPGGYAHFKDTTGDGTRIIAPGVYLGDWSGFDGTGTIAFDHLIVASTGVHAVYQGTISGPGGFARWASAQLPGSVGQWVAVTAPLIEGHWCVVSGAWADILADVTEFTVEIELVFGSPDVEGIDNVVLAGTGAVKCPGDLDYDGEVGIVDFLEMIARWGGCGADLDGDGAVGINDFLELLANWGPCP